MKSSGIGGQAVLEGIMMKNADKYSVAVRKPGGEIELEVGTCSSFIKWKQLTKIPFIRGIFNFIDSLILGMKTLTFSASFLEDEENNETEAEKSEGEAQKEEALTKEAYEAEVARQKRRDDWMMGITVAASLILAIGIFLILPYFLAGLFGKVIPSLMIRTIVEGVLRLLIFFGYILLISRMKDIRRLYMYHGAEHKCINCIEHGLELTVENVRKSSRQHKRCGTSFLLFVMLVSIVLFFFIRVDSTFYRVIIRLLLAPVIAGISYELIRLAGRSENKIISLLSKPGLWLQKLTTKEPDDEMIEVGIQAVEAVFDWRAYLSENFS